MLSPGFAQQILNGGFEDNTATADAINLVNSAYNDLMPNSFAFGGWNGGGASGGDLDIISSSDYCGAPQEGSWFVALTSGGSDAFSLTCSPALTEGVSYILTFQDRTCSGWPTGARVEIGLSTVPDDFGTPLYNAPDPVLDGGWTPRSTSFIAPISGAYLTVRCGGPFDGGPWTQVDNFQLSSHTGVPSTQENLLRISPMPATDQLTLSGLQGLAHRAVLFDVLGQVVRTWMVQGTSATLDLAGVAPGRYVLQLNGTGPGHTVVIQ